MPSETAVAISHKAAELEKSLRRVIRGKDDVVRLALVSIFARGHLLIEGVPGVGKTTLGQALARAIDCTFQRVQFTSDMLPSDVLGISVYSAAEQEFESSGAGLCLRMSCSRMKSIAPLQRRNRHCWRR